MERVTRRVIAALVALGLTAFGAGPAQAQSNYKLAPVGGRTTLVGGTGLTYGRDSASAFLNPATVVNVDPGRLAFSVNFYQVSLFTASSWYQPGNVDRSHFGDVGKDQASVTTAGFDTLPGSLCLFLRVGDIKALAKEQSKGLAESQARLGICLASVLNDDFSLNLDDYQQQTATGGSRQGQTIRQSFRRIAVGPTYSMYVSNALAVGASVHVSRAGFRSIFESTATTYGGGRQPVTSAYYTSAHGDSYDLSATLGALYRIGRYQSVAIALEAPSLHVFGAGGTNRYTHFDGAGEATSTVTAHGKFAAYTPLRVAIGTGIQRAWGSAELNVSYHLPVGPAYRASLNGRAVDVVGGVARDQEVALDLSVKPRGVVNIGIGAEFITAPYISLLTGIGTDVSTAPISALTSDPLNYFPAREHRVTASLGLGSHGEGGDLLIGGELSYTFGERVAVNSYQVPPQLDITSTKAYGLLIVIAGSTSYKAIKRAVNDLTEAVDPTKGKKPPEPPKKPAEPPKTPAPPEPFLTDPKG